MTPISPLEFAEINPAIHIALRMQFDNIIIVIKINIVKNLEKWGYVIPSVFHNLNFCLRKSLANMFKCFLMHFGHRDSHI